VTDNPVWLNGSPGTRIDPADRGFTLGDGVFDTAVAFNRKSFAGERHLQRLASHATAIGIALDLATVRAGWSAVIDAAKSEHVILRTTVTRGIAARGLWPKTAGGSPTIAVSATPWSTNLVGKPVRLIVSSVARNAGSPVSRLKAIGYLDSILAAREAAERGADDALLLNGSGKIACSTIANLFVLIGGKLATPPVSDGVMAGVVRALVLEIAAALGMEASDRSLEVMDLFAADEVFLTNSVRLVSPVQSLDARAVGGRDGGRLERLIAALAERVRAEHGFDPRAR
jgi:branched-chain amino acid aminotransferase